MSNLPQKDVQGLYTNKLLEELGLQKDPAKQAQLLVEIEAVLKAAPPEPSLTNLNNTRAELEWAGTAAASISQWSSSRGASFHISQTMFSADFLSTRVMAYRQMMMLLHEAQRDLRLKVVGPLNVAIDKGGVFDYFDGLKDIIKQATTDVLFVDAYLSDEFVSRYLPHVKDGATIRLLTSPGRDARHLNQLLPAVDMFAAQHGHAVHVRTTKELHDRYVFVDRARCFSSGASFKDGAKNAGTTITQMLDVFDAVQRVYEDLWNSAKIER